MRNERSSSEHSGLDFNSDAGPRVTVCISGGSWRQPSGGPASGTPRGLDADSCSPGCAQESEGRLSSKQTSVSAGGPPSHAAVDRNPSGQRGRGLHARYREARRAPGATPRHSSWSRGLAGPAETLTVYRHRSRRQQNDRQQIIKKKDNPTENGQLRHSWKKTHAMNM